MATVTFRGGAVAVKQVDTITVANTWATNDTATMTINGRDITVTIGTDATTANVATIIKEAINGDTQTGTGDHTVSPPIADGGGQAIPEFTEVVATVFGSVVTVTANTAGKPFTMSVTESTAGSGTATEATATTATGPEFWSNADNWDGGSLPADSDDIVFDANSGSVKYGLDQNAITPNSISIREGFDGEIGLPETNEDSSSNPYPEYRDTALIIGNSGDANPYTVTIDSSQLGAARFNFNTGQVTVNVFNTGQPALDGTPNVIVKGSHASNELNVNRGSVGVAYLPGETATVATLRVGYVENPAGDATVVCSSGVTLTNVDQQGGNLTVESNTTTLDVLDGDLTVLAGAHAAINIDGGVCHYRSTGTLTTLNVGNGGEADFQRDMRSRTITNMNVYAGSTVRDPFQTVTFTNGLDLVRCGLPDVTVDLGVHRTYALSAI